MDKGFLKSGKPRLLTLNFFLLGMIGCGILLRIVYLGKREFWYDEVLSLALSTGHKMRYFTTDGIAVALANYQSLLQLPQEQGFGAVAQTVATLLRGLAAEPHPALFFLSQHFWLRWWGRGEAAMRSLEMLTSILAIASGYGLGRVLLGLRGGLLLAALLAVNPFYFFHALNVRMYTAVVLWMALSAWAILALHFQQQREDRGLGKTARRDRLFWTVILMGSVAAGCMTVYYFLFYGTISLFALAFYLGWRRNGWRDGLPYAVPIGLGILITTPWLWWGLRQQLRNADLDRFNTSSNFWEIVSKHTQEVAQTIGINLIVGDVATSIPLGLTFWVGIASLCLLAFASWSLWQQGKRQLVVIALLLSLFPLALVLLSDILTGKYTLGFGWGRSVILILPGCLLLLASWIEQGIGSWRSPVAIGFLVLYLGIIIGDYSLRDRQVFASVRQLIAQNPNIPTLIALNTQADGHVLRLAYYLPPSAPIFLLAEDSAHLAPALAKVLQQKKVPYSRVILLESARPVWSPPKTEADKAQFQQDVRSILDKNYQRVQETTLVGTSLLDEFQMGLYQRLQASEKTHKTL
jgi:uncharacterized membrane protein